MTPWRGTRPVPPWSFFVGSAVFHYLGPAFAVLLFARVDVLGVAWLRIAGAGAVFACWRRPWCAWARAPRDERTTIVAWGAVLAVMNVCFYVAIDQVPLGTVAAIEFVGPVALAVVGVRSARNVGALLLAVAGVAALVDVRLAGAPAGFAFAAANAALFAGYVLLGHRVSRQRVLGGIDGLAAAMIVAALVVTPLGGAQAAPVVLDPVALLAGIGVGICSSVIPYVFDQLAMRRMSRASYSLLVSLLPATATVIGIVVLAQVPTVVEVGGVVLVIAAVAVHRDVGGGEVARGRGGVVREGPRMHTGVRSAAQRTVDRQRQGRFGDRPSDMEDTADKWLPHAGVAVPATCRARVECDGNGDRLAGSGDRAGESHQPDAAFVGPVVDLHDLASGPGTGVADSDVQSLPIGGELGAVERPGRVPEAMPERKRG
jgi:inner membrane transporter RhtA